MTEEDKRSRLRDLSTAYRQCMNPDVARLRTSAKYVPGRGNVHAAVVFVGEAPGATEDRLRIPFCGASGRVLDKALTEIGLTRDDVWVTNTVKHRPPNNRKPSVPEVAASVPFLRREITIINPAIVVTLGRVALTALAPETTVAGLETLLGQVVTNPSGLSYPVMPSYHPAVTMYNPNTREDFARTFLKLREWLDDAAK